MEIIKLFLEIILYKEKNKGIELGIKKLKEEIEYEREKIKELIIKIYNEDLEKFFEVLEKRGVLKIGEIVEELIKNKKNIIFIIESGECSPRGNEIYFSRFMKEEFRKIVGDKAEIYPIPIPGTSSFIIFYNDIDIDELYDKLYTGYSKYIDVKVQKDLAKLKNEEKRKELEDWYKKSKEYIENRQMPLILITMPYKASLYSLFTALEKKYFDDENNMKCSKKKDDKKKKRINKKLKSIIRIMEDKISDILKQEIELKSAKIRFVYLFEAVGFSEEVIKQFEKLENNIVEKLRKDYEIRDKDFSKKYFSELLKKENFINKFEESMEKIDKDFYNKIKNDVRYRRLKILIMDIQLKIFGVPVQNISI
ncbi:MAG: hypothetical protein ACO2ON_00690 [Candidatus Nanopusillus sp.]